MVHYSDSAQKVFETMIEDLKGNIPEDLISDLEKVLAEGKIHDIEYIQRLIKNEITKSSNRD